MKGGHSENHLDEDRIRLPNENLRDEGIKKGIKTSDQRFKCSMKKWRKLNCCQHVQDIKEKHWELLISSGYESNKNKEKEKEMHDREMSLET